MADHEPGNCSRPLATLHYVARSCLSVAFTVRRRGNLVGEAPKLLGFRYAGSPIAGEEMMYPLHGHRVSSTNHPAGLLLVMSVPCVALDRRMMRADAS